MLTYKIIIDKRHLNKDKTYSLKLRLFQNTIYKETSLNISVKENEWDEINQTVLTENSYHQIYNSKLASIKAKIQKQILLSEDDEEISITEILEIVTGKTAKKKEVKKLDIFQYGNEQVEKLKKLGNVGNAIAYSCSIVRQML